MAKKEKPTATKEKPTATKEKPVATKEKPVATKEKPVATEHALRLAQDGFQEMFYRCRVNPKKVPLEDVARAFQAWELTREKYDLECQTATEHYLQRPHAERLTYAEHYATYQTALKDARIAFETATLGNQERTRRTYLAMCQKPPILFKTPSNVYTTDYTSSS